MNCEDDFVRSYFEERIFVDSVNFMKINMEIYLQIVTILSKIAIL